ncbi:MAG: hypothetical protein JRJ85_12310 [Deltaproteobacteria bacterium]|nr:hypothetical protein [Deltaproteobacteria bacterium]
MKKNILGMGIAALLLAVLAYKQGGWPRLGHGCLIGGEMLIQLLPLIILALITSGLISVMISEKAVSRWRGRESGWKGLFWGAMTGAIMPGGPYVYFPLSATFLRFTVKIREEIKGLQKTNEVKT